MAEVFAVIGIVASIAQLIDLTSKVICRLDKYQIDGRESDKTLQNLKTELDLLRETLQQIKNSVDPGFDGDGNETTLLSSVRGCWDQIGEFDAIITKTLPSSDDSFPTRFKKIRASRHRDAEVNRITKTLNRHIRTLTLYFVVKPATPRILPGRYCIPSNSFPPRCIRLV